ncbi:MAG: hypothetical protein RBR88_07770, partial [Candidatus Saccharicenans sp.]|nr:hypothetical protein [Candidatus Saccharicenans sp.]
GLIFSTGFLISVSATINISTSLSPVSSFLAREPNSLISFISVKVSPASLAAVFNSSRSRFLSSQIAFAEPDEAICHIYGYTKKVEAIFLQPE